MMANLLKSGTFAFVRIAPLSWCLSWPFQLWWLHRVYFRIWCPGDAYMRVRDCIAAGECCCYNQHTKNQ